MSEVSGIQRAKLGNSAQLCGCAEESLRFNVGSLAENNRLIVLPSIEASRMATDSFNKFSLDNATHWITRWEKNDWKTRRNKPVKNGTEQEEMMSTFRSMAVIWNRVPNHEGVYGNKLTEKLAREGLGKYFLTTLGISMTRGNSLSDIKWLTKFHHHPEITSTNFLL